MALFCLLVTIAIYPLQYVQSPIVESYFIFSICHEYIILDCCFGMNARRTLEVYNNNHCRGYCKIVIKQFSVAAVQEPILLNDVNMATFNMIMCTINLSKDHTKSLAYSREHFCLQAMHYKICLSVNCQFACLTAHNIHVSSWKKGADIYKFANRMFKCATVS